MTHAHAQAQSLFGPASSNFQNHLPNRPTEFCVHPLIAIEHYIRFCNVNNTPNFPRTVLFSDVPTPSLTPGGPSIEERITQIKDVDIPNYEDLRDHVMDAVEYFRTEHTMRKLAGYECTSWQHKIMDTLNDMDRNQLRNEDLRSICKLIPFYEFDQEVLTLADMCVSAHEHQDIAVTQNFKDLRLLKVLTPRTLGSRGKKAYFFRTPEKHLMRVDFDELVSSAVDTILKINQTISLDMTTSSRIIHSSNFTYYTVYKINSIGA